MAVKRKDAPVRDLRSALEFLRGMQGQLAETEVEVDPAAELSGVYRYVGAGGYCQAAHAHERSGDALQKPQGPPRRLGGHRRPGQPGARGAPAGLREGGPRPAAVRERRAAHCPGAGRVARALPGGRTPGLGAGL